MGPQTKRLKSASWETTVAEDRSIHAKLQRFPKATQDVQLDQPQLQTGSDAMVSDRLRVRLSLREAVLRLLDRRRAEVGDPNLGSNMEKRILDLELADLETTMAIQESDERTIIRESPPERADT